MDIEKALSKLYSMHKFGIKLGLEKTINLMNYLCNPQKKFKSIHIAGSNGKGSTASFMASILMEAGYKIGLYTSPHLIRFNERIRINKIEIPDKYIAEFIFTNEKYIDINKPTFFEITTAMAFKYFSDEHVDIAIIETGLGGRLDATNVIIPLSAVITTVSLEHTNILGTTIEKIAAEKGGIIKERTPVFCGVIKNDAKNILREIADSKNAKIEFLDERLEIKNSYVKIISTDFNYYIYKTSLLGEYQKLNAALAIYTLYKVLSITNQKIINRGIRNIVENTGFYGRYEIYNRSPRIIFDGAHNVSGIKAFLSQFKKEKFKYKKCFLIFGAMEDKNLTEMLNLLKLNFDKIFITSINYQRAASTDLLKGLCDDLNIAAEVLQKPWNFIINFTQKKDNNCLVVLGSIYILGEIKLKLLNKIS